MADEPYDTYIDFGFDDDEATSFASPAESQDLPPFLVEILAALNSESTSSLVEAPTANAPTFRSPQTPAAPFISYAQNILPFYYPIPALSSSLRGPIGENGPSTCVCPSDTIYVPGFHSAAPPAPPVPAVHVLPAYQPPNPYVHVPSTFLHPMPTKRPSEHMEHHAHHEQSSPRKRQRMAPSGSGMPDIGHASNTIANALHFRKDMAEAASGGPNVVPPMDWGAPPGPESNTVVDPSILENENVPVPRKSRKRAGKENSSGPTTSKKRNKKTALADAPDVLNAPVTPYSGLQFVDCAPLPGHAGDQTSTTLRSATYPELTPEFYDELSNIASEIAQELRQASGVDDTSTSQAEPGSSTFILEARQDSPEPPSATTKGKRPRPSASSRKPYKKRQRAQNPDPTNSGGTDPRPEKPFACPFQAHPTKPCRVRFSRKTDIRRHIRTHHLGLKMFCKHEVHDDGPFRVSREDGLFRHLGFNTCIGGEARSRLVVEYKEANGGESAAGTSESAKQVEKQIGRRYTLFRMPCSHRVELWEDAERFSGWTPDALEEWCMDRGTVERHPCQSCGDTLQAGDDKAQILDKEQTPGTRPSSVAEPIAGSSPSGADAPAEGLSTSLDVLVVPDDEDWDDDRLPPEEEEGVDEDVPQVSPPAVANTAVVAAQDHDAVPTTPVAENTGAVPSELQAIYDLLSGLPDDTLKVLLCGPDGNQLDDGPTLDGQSDDK